MAWITGGAIIGSSVLGGLFGNKAASKAADAQTQAAEQAIAEQRRQFDQTQQLQAPFVGTGVAGNQRLRYLMGLGGNVAGDPNEQLTPDAVKSLYRHYLGRDPDQSEIAWQLANTKTAKNFEDTIRGSTEFQLGGRPDPGRLYSEGGGGAGDPGAGFLTRRFAASDLQADPVYQSGLKFGLDQGTGAINARAIAGGGYDSGATIKALTRYANDYGSTKGNESFNRFTNEQSNIYNKLSGISGGGQVATGQVQSAGTNAANSIANLDTSAGAARSAGIVGGANAWNSALSGAAKGVQYGMWGNPYQKPNPTGGDPYAPGYGGSSYNQLYGASYGPGGDQLYG